MSTVQTLNIQITADGAKADRILKALQGEIDATAKTADRAGKSFGGLGNIIGGLGIGAAAAGVMALGKSMVDANAEMEKYTTQFNVLLGSADRAQTVLADLKKFAIDTPFEFPELAESATKLTAFGIAAEDLVPKLKAIGDIASGVGQPIGELSEIYGKARIAGTLMAEDINQLTGRGIPVIQEFAKQLGVSEGEVKKLAAEGKVTFGMLDQAFTDLTTKGGKFAGMMDAQSKTFSGMVSNLKGAMDEILLQIGGPIFDVVKNLVGTLSEMLSDPAVQQALKTVSELLSNVVGQLGKALLPVLQTLMQSLLPPLSTLMGIVAKVMERFGPMLLRLSPVLGKIAQVIGDLLTALEPLIDAIMEMSNVYLEMFVAQLEIIAEVLLVITPILKLLTPLIAAILTPALKFVNSVIKPIHEGIAYIIQYGQKAANFIAQIFGGGGDAVTKAQKVAEQAPSVTPTATAPSDDPLQQQTAVDEKAAKAAKDAWMRTNDLRGLMYEMHQTRMEHEREWDRIDRENAAKRLQRVREERDARAEAMRRLTESDRQRREAADQATMAMMESERRAEEMRIEFLGNEFARIDARKRYALEQFEDELRLKRISQAEYDALVLQSELETQQTKSDVMVGMASQMFSSLEGMAAEHTAANKAFAIAQAIMNTFSGATKALEQGGPLGIPLMATVIAVGMAQVAKIASVKPGSGGGSGGGGGASGASAAGSSGPGVANRNTMLPAPGVPTERARPIAIDIKGELVGRGSELAAVVSTAIVASHQESL